MTATEILVGGIVLLSIAGFYSSGLIGRMKHYPYREWKYGEWYRLLTAGFFHVDWIHLLINAWVLWEFGRVIEAQFVHQEGPLGQWLFLGVFILTVIIANIPTAIMYRRRPLYSAVGASGGVSGIIALYALFYPWRKIYLYGIIGIHSVVAVVLYLAYSAWAARHARDGVDHYAHFFGTVTAPLLVSIYRPEWMTYLLEHLLR